MKLVKLEIENFGCIARRTINFYDGETIISGRNASGKTTIKNAFFWLFGFDSGIKPQPINSDGTTDYARIPKVKAYIRHNDREYTLERSFRKNNSVYVFDDYETSKKDYLNRVMSEFGIDELTLDFISSPEYFFTGTSTDRRARLLDLLCIHETDFYDEATKNALKGHRIEESITKLKREAKDIEKTLNALPKQIEEAKLGMPQVAETKEELDSLAKDLLVKIKLAEQGNDFKEVYAADNALYEAKEKLELLEKDYKAAVEHLEKTLQNTLELEGSTSESIAELTEQRKVYRDEYVKLKEQDYHGSKTCPTCGHEIPEPLRKSYEEKFNAEKAEKMTNLVNKGKKLGNTIAEMQEKLEAAQSKHYALVNELERTNVEYSAKIEEKKKEIESLKENFNKTRSAYTDNESAELNELRAKHSEVVKKTALLAIAEERKGRIVELNKQFEITKDAYAKTLNELNSLVDTRRKVAAELEKAVNSKFRYIQWKLTDICKNGEIEDTCDATINGVRFANLNSGSKINAICDCYNVICGNHEVPLFLDNAEQVTSWISMPEGKQIIKLYAEPTDLTIREGE